MNMYALDGTAKSFDSFDDEIGTLSYTGRFRLLGGFVMYLSMTNPARACALCAVGRSTEAADPLSSEQTSRS